jgi:putative toxin-antitoxin system antitoxin component (TIGR02293 family)
MHSVVTPRPGSHAGFWSLPTRNLERSWRAPWERLVDQLRTSDPQTLYRAVEEGVPPFTVVLLSKALGEPVPRVLEIIGLAETTYRRKSEADESLPEAAGHRAMALMRVVARLRQLLAESGDPQLIKDFDLEAWVRDWIKEPLPELDGVTPAALLRNPEGQRVVENLLERMRGGLAA